MRLLSGLRGVVGGSFCSGSSVYDLIIKVLQTTFSDIALQFVLFCEIGRRTCVESDWAV